MAFAYDAEVKPHDILITILRNTAFCGSKLMKLKLTKMDLNNHEIVKLLIETVNFNKNMISVDLSYSNLIP